MIISGGENIYPAEIENVLMAHPDVTDVAVIGCRVLTNSPVAVIVTRPGAVLSGDEVIAHCRTRLPPRPAGTDAVGTDRAGSSRLSPEHGARFAYATLTG